MTTNQPVIFVAAILRATVNTRKGGFLLNVMKIIIRALTLIYLLIIRILITIGPFSYIVVSGYVQL